MLGRSAGTFPADPFQSIRLTLERASPVKANFRVQWSRVNGKSCVGFGSCKADVWWIRNPARLAVPSSVAEGRRASLSRMRESMAGPPSTEARCYALGGITQSHFASGTPMRLPYAAAESRKLLAELLEVVDRRASVCNHSAFRSDFL